MSTKNSVHFKNFYECLKLNDSKQIIERGDALLAYLRPFSIKMKPNGLLHVILKRNWKLTEQITRDQASITLAINYIEYILFKIPDQPTHLEAFKQSLITTIADLFSVVKRLDSSLGNKFLLGSTNTQSTSVQYLHAEILFYTNKIGDGLNRYEIDHIIIPFLRTILESKIKHVLGVDIFRDDKNKSVEISRLLELLPKLKTIQLDKAFDVSMLKLIMEWLNHHMHRNLRPPPYIIHAVFEYLKPIFAPGQRKKGNQNLLSINISAFASDLGVYHQEVEQVLKEKYPKCFISWTGKEVASFNMWDTKKQGN